MNFFFWFNDTVLDRTLVQVVTSPQLPQKIMIRTDLPEQVVNDWSMTYWLMIFSAKLLIIYIYINLNLNDSSVGPASTSEVLLLHSEQESTRSCFCSVMVGKEGAFLKIFGLFSCIDSFTDDHEFIHAYKICILQGSAGYISMELPQSPSSNLKDYGTVLLYCYDSDTTLTTAVFNEVFWSEF